MFIGGIALNGRVQYSLPLVGSSDRTPSSVQTINCLTPPAWTMIGWPTPGSEVVSSERQTSLPVILSQATTSASGSPPTIAMRREPSTIGALADPVPLLPTPYSAM
jgi:hypothetical protein